MGMYCELSLLTRFVLLLCYRPACALYNTGTMNCILCMHERTQRIQLACGTPAYMLQQRPPPYLLEHSQGLHGYCSSPWNKRQAFAPEQAKYLSSMLKGFGHILFSRKIQRNRIGANSRGILNCVSNKLVQWHLAASKISIDQA